METGEKIILVVCVNFILGAYFVGLGLGALWYRIYLEWKKERQNADKIS